MGSLSVALKNKVDCAGVQGGVQSGEVCQRVMRGFFSADSVAGVLTLGSGRWDSVSCVSRESLKYQAAANIKCPTSAFAGRTLISMS